ncbi:hypothetical protein [Streptacidiphilus albus]|uniref:hypothetical protein n=1 Tax=Streptacidiphilus albus TaxID=105425 RepID=UPI00054C6315|nr:hypothetical protein [Streptacidiphilus albus]
MNREHAEDTAAMDAAPWTHGDCGSCRKARAVTPTVGGDPMCRECLAYALLLDRGCREPLKTLTAVGAPR